MAESSSMPLVAYRLNELGWLQFDRLCSLLLEVEGGLDEVGWRGRSDTERIATVVGPVVLRDQQLRGPVTVAVIWVVTTAGRGCGWRSWPSVRRRCWSSRAGVGMRSWCSRP